MTKDKMNTYEREQALTDKYGDMIMNQIASSFYDKSNIERVTDKETQVKGVDYYFWKQTANERVIKQKVDLKFDYWENSNFVFETHQQYTGIGEQSWIYHDRDIWVAYFKIYQRKVYLIKTADLQDFMNTDVYKNRKVFETERKVNGKSGGFKNFKFEELPVDRIIKIDLAVNPFETDNLLETKSSLLDAVLYRNC
jgi:hypothetical protein